jgi:hypothetical protein
LSVLYLAALLVLQSPAPVGPVAKQGSLAYRLYASPMVVEMPLPKTARDAVVPVEGRERLREFVCEGVRIDRITIRVLRHPIDPRGKIPTGHIEADLTLANQKGTDRSVDVLAEIVHDDVVLATTTIRKVEVEEEKRTVRPLQWRLDADLLPADLREVTLRLTLTVIKD